MAPRVEVHNLETAIAFVKRSRRRPAEIRVDIKGWVRIKREIRGLCRVLETPYSAVPKAEKWLWHERRALMKLAPIQILGVPVRLEKSK